MANISNKKLLELNIFGYINRMKVIAVTTSERTKKMLLHRQSKKNETNLLIKKHYVNSHQIPSFLDVACFPETQKTGYHRLRTTTGLQIIEKYMGWNHSCCLCVWGGRRLNRVKLWDFENSASLFIVVEIRDLRWGWGHGKLKATSWENLNEIDSG